MTKRDNTVLGCVRNLELVPNFMGCGRVNENDD